MVAQVGSGLGAKFAQGAIVKPKHSARYWANVTAGLDFSDADQVPPEKFNRIVWRGIKGGKPYPKRGASARAHTPWIDSELTTSRGAAPSRGRAGKEMP